AGFRGPGGGGVRVDDAVPVVVVGHPAHVLLDPHGAGEDLLELLDVEGGVGLEDQGGDAADVRGGHRGPRDGAVLRPGVERPGRPDLVAGGADLGLDVLHPVPDHRAAAGEAGDVVVAVRRADGEGVRVVTR